MNKNENKNFFDMILRICYVKKVKYIKRRNTYKLFWWHESLVERKLFFFIRLSKIHFSRVVHFFITPVPLKTFFFEYLYIVFDYLRVYQIKILSRQKWGTITKKSRWIHHFKRNISFVDSFHNIYFHVTQYQTKARFTYG